MTEAYAEEGILVNSGKFDGMENLKALESIADYLESHRPRQTHDSIPPARLGNFPPALLGRAHSHD